MNMLLDSGAFSSWKLGTPIDIGKYAEYLNDNKAFYEYAINLDAIPGKFGAVPTHQEVVHAAELSYKNLGLLEKQGLKIWPVFHQGEDFKWLDRMIRDGHMYICISPDNGKNVTQKQAWLDLVFAAICNKDGLPVVKTHGLAVTSADLVFRFPWASVDSATWIQLGGFGGTFVPKYEGGKFVYDKSPTSVIVSRKATSSMVNGSHFDGFGADTKKHITEFFEQEGYTFDDIAETFEARSVICIRVLNRIAHAPKPPTFFGANSFLKPKVDISGCEPVHIDKVKIYFALSCAAIYSDMLTTEKVDDRLFTYHILQGKEPGFLEFYAKTGTYPMAKCTKRWVNAGNVGEILDPPLLLPKTDVGNSHRKADPIKKLRRWKR